MDRPAQPRWWLIAKHDGGRMEVLTVEVDSGEEALPLFSFEEEAELFRVGLGVSGEGQRVRPTTGGELVSVLMGPCAGVGRVLLDPLPAFATGPAADLVGVEREEFLGHLVGRGKASSVYGPPRASSPGFYSHNLGEEGSSPKFSEESDLVVPGTRLARAVMVSVLIHSLIEARTLPTNVFCTRAPAGSSHPKESFAKSDNFCRIFS